VFTLYLVTEASWCPLGSAAHHISAVLARMEFEYGWGMLLIGVASPCSLYWLVMFSTGRDHLGDKQISC